MADDTLTIFIDEGGRVSVEGRAALRRLASRPGRYRLVPSSPNLVILERVEPAPGTGERINGHILLSGDIERIGGLVDVIQFIHTNQWSGQLAIIHNTVRKAIYFKQGDVTTAASNVPEDRIGAILYRYGMITQEELERTLQQVTQEQRFGQILVDNGIITAHDLYQFVRKQIEEIFYSALVMRQGEYYFYRTAKDSGPPAQLQLSTKSLLFEGVRRIDEMSYFRERLPSSDVVLIQRYPEPDHRLPPREARVFALVDGVRDIASIARESHLGEFETTKVLFQMVHSGHVQVRETPVGTTTTNLSPSERCLQVIDLFNEAYKKVHETATAHGQQTALESSLSSFFESMTEFAPLFVGVQSSSDGSLPRDAVLANLEMAPIGEKQKLDYLYRGLNELLSFQMFIASEGTDHRPDPALSAQLTEILRELPAITKTSAS